MNGLKGALAVGEIMFYPLYLFPALLGWVISILPVLALKNAGVDVTVPTDTLMSILDPTENLR